MNARCLLVIALLAASIAPAQSNRDDLTPLDIHYTTRVLDDLQSVAVTVDVNHLARPHTRIAMPNWTPGAYGIGQYGRRALDLEVKDGDGKALATTRLDNNTWSIETGGIRKMSVSYRVSTRGRFGRRGRAASGPATGLRISGPSTYVYVQGAKSRPVTASYQIPEGWRIANGLLPTADANTKKARDFDTFIDAPTILGVFKDYHFDVAGTPFTCIFFNNEQRYDFDLEAFVDVCKKIVTYQGEFYGSFPFPNYVFLFTIPGGGGLEHLNSTTIGLNPQRMKTDVRAGASVTSHEFFHTWNVKRIRPKVLGPFEYEHENYTGNLWVSEGWTSYYGDVTMVRTGIISRPAFLNLFEGYIRRELTKESRKTHSVYWASRNVWHRSRDESPRVDYYAKGEILGACIDLIIRHETKNRKTLDDVMRFMNRWFAERNTGFEEHDIERACTAVSNHDFSEFFARHVHGTLDPPLAECFGYAGIDYQARHLDASFPFTYRGGNAGLRVFSRLEGRVEGEKLPDRGDVIVAVDGAEVSNAVELLAKHRPGEKVALTVERGGEKIKMPVTLIERKTMIPSLKMIENPSELQRQIREGWLSGR